MVWIFQCEAELTQSGVLSLSKVESLKFKQIKVANSLRKYSGLLHITFPRILEVTEIQILAGNPTIVAQPSIPLGRTLKRGGALEISCRVEAIPFTDITWKCSKAVEDCPKEGNVKGFHTLRGWTSVLTVNQTGTYSCLSMGQANTMYISEAKVCDVRDLEEIENGHAWSNNTYKVSRI